MKQNYPLRGLKALWETLLATLLLIPISILAQKGPGGVSLENGNQSTCRIWYDASSLTSLADGDELSSWPDISNSTINDAAYAPGGSFLPPYFRDDAAFSINGHPVVTFDQNRLLLINTSNDANSELVTYTKTVFFAFRTSSDVTSKQVIYEEGGTDRGFNVNITNGNIYVGAYDRQTDGDGTGPWGYTFSHTPIQPNTTYVLTAEFSAPTAGVVKPLNNTNNFFVKGFLNGQEFNNMQSQPWYIGNNGPYGAPGIGTLHNHPDPSGLGAVNSDYVDEDGCLNNHTGDDPFQGKMAEVAYYNDLLNSTQRVIVENYLGAKYFANILTIDRYAFQANYGEEVIGIGQYSSLSSEQWNLSQGRNPFIISPTNSYNSSNTFFLTGHDYGNMIWTDQNIPNDASNTRRLQRIWRADRTGNIGDIHLEVHSSALPNLPAGFTKLVLIVDDHDANFPNFASNSTKVYGFKDDGSGKYEIDYNIPDGAFYTIGVVKPVANFTTSSTFSVEGDPLPDSTYIDPSSSNVKVSLNYIPAFGDGGVITVGYRFVNGTAIRSSDYGYDPNEQQAGVDVSSYNSGTNQIPVYIVNDLVQEDPATEYFYVILDQSTTSPGISIGSSDTLVYYIYDNDPPPKATFQLGASSVLENAGTAQVTVLRTGSTAGTSTVNVYQISNSGDTHPATNGVDYSFPYYNLPANNPVLKTITFPPGASSETFDVTILDDQIDEYDETIELGLSPGSNISTDANSQTTHTLTITDDDPEPVATFLAPTAEGYSTIGNPYLYVLLDRQSAKDVTVAYQVSNTGSHPATLGTDYSISTPGTVTFPPMDTLAYPTSLTILNNGIPADSINRTVTLQLLSTGTVNATLGSQNQEVYTIINYSPFEWQGAAGVGKASDNIVWVDADRTSGNNGDVIQSLPNFSTRNISVSQSSTNARATLNVTNSNTINGRRTLSFDGNDFYEIQNDGVINLAGPYSKKAYFMVVKTGSDITSQQILFEEGGPHVD